MFTGIIEETGAIRALRRNPAGAVLLIEAASIPRTLKLGDSVAINGVCLTVIEASDRSFLSDLSGETLKRSTFGRAREDTIVNLERPLAAGDRLGGHIVQGHVDDIGTLVSVVSAGNGVEMEFGVPAEFERYLVNKGSVAVDGVSLTVATLRNRSFTVAVIPHTYRATNLGVLKPGDSVNLEADILAKYIERFFQLGLTQNHGKPLTAENLREQGF